ncbi:hypothetical protein NLU13_3209 [Sarocladium strictum]|uniref:Uncharacterized protein n=1 Tax=Sarocladium strictum TaxID=5046 RepID=A0AA39GND6_SARSR|nr:hypothetical protein NLU13_3209 [Sarocladium strictum]
MEEKRVVPECPQRTWVSKLTMRAISASLDLALVGVTAKLGTSFFAVVLIFMLPPAGVALVWNIAEGICILARGGHRGIHPGACVGVDLILWLGFCASSFLYLFFGYGWYWYTTKDIFGSRQATYFTLNRTALILGFLEVVVHFVLFVIACVETSKRNQPATVIVYQPPPGMVHAPAYHPQSMIFQPDQFNQHPHQPMIIPASYQPPLQGYQGPVMYQQQAPQGHGNLSKHEADSTPISVPSPAYDAYPGRQD